jgi:AAA domain
METPTSDPTQTEAPTSFDFREFADPVETEAGTDDLRAERKQEPEVNAPEPDTQTKATMPNPEVGSKPVPFEPEEYDFDREFQKYAESLDWSGVVVESKDWRKRFRTLSQLEQGDVKMLIDRVLPEGIAFLGSLSGIGKTWVALSLAKALRTGKPFLSLFNVPEKVAVAYLVPEMSGRSVRKRAEKLGMPDDDLFRCWTLRDGVLRLDDPHLKAMIKELRPVVFLDTVIRFSSGADENSSAANSVGLANAIFELLRLGARAVVCLHHSPKASGKATSMTLENALRGTGDLGAMAEVVWGIERDRRKKGKGWDAEYAKESEVLTRLRLECVKGRDLENVAGTLVIQGRPYIDEEGDFRVLSHDGIAMSAVPEVDRLEKMVAAVEKDQKMSLRALSRMSGLSTNMVKAALAGKGWDWDEDRLWHRFESGVITLPVGNGDSED